jgi:hypothetical protein
LDCTVSALTEEESFDEELTLMDSFLPVIGALRLPDCGPFSLNTAPGVVEIDAPPERPCRCEAERSSPKADSHGDMDRRELAKSANDRAQLPSSTRTV